MDNKIFVNLAIVPARGGSKGIKNKNFLKINQKYLTTIAIDIGLSIKYFDFVIFSSDSLKILNTHKNHKKLLKLQRSKHLAKDKTPMIDVLKNTINQFERLKGKKVNSITILDPTSPLRKVSDVKNAIQIFERFKPSCLISAHESSYNPYFTMLEKKKIILRYQKNFRKN